MRKQRIRFYLLVLLSLLSMVPAFGALSPKPVQAVKEPSCAIVAYGRCLALGFLSNEARHDVNGTNGANDFPWPNPFCYAEFMIPNGCWVFPDYINSNNPNVANDFINFVWSALNRPYHCPPGFGCNNKAQPWFNDRRWVTGAAWIINVMYGDFSGGLRYRDNWQANTGDAGILVGIQHAFQNFNAWAALVREYQEAGLIEWKGGRVYGHHVNTTGVGVGFPGRDVDAFWYGFYGEGTEYVLGIIFKNPDGSDNTVLNRSCLNGIGSPLGLLDLTYDIRGTFETPTRSVPADAPYPLAGVVEPGKKYSMGLKIQNFGDLNSPATQPLLQTYVRSKISRNSQWVSHVDMNGNDFKPEDSTGTYTRPNNDLGPGGESGTGIPSSQYCFGQNPCWWWHYGDDWLLRAGGKNGTSVAHTTFSFQVSDSATSGQLICFAPYSRFRTQAQDDWTPGETCFRVEEPRKPFLSTQQGDIHAGARFGDTPCFEPSINQGSVTGTVKNANGSKADYVVSSGGDIRNFGSAGTPTSNNLTFGNNSNPGGRYGRVCRADVAKDALQDGILDGQAVADFNQAIFSVSAIPDGISKHVGNVTINAGTIPVRSRKTLIVQGDVYITGNVGFFGGPYGSISDIPSLGIIASGNIHVDPGVTSLYGIYYAGTNHDLASGGWDPGHAAGGVINTCRIGFGRNPEPPFITLTPGACGNQLNVQGALIANNIYFRRTFGDASTGTGAAETINLIPQLMLRPPDGLDGLANQIRSNGERPPVF